MDTTSAISAVMLSKAPLKPSEIHYIRTRAGLSIWLKGIFLVLMLFQCPSPTLVPCRPMRALRTLMLPSRPNQVMRSTKPVLHSFKKKIRVRYTDVSDRHRYQALNARTIGNAVAGPPGGRVVGQAGQGVRPGLML